MCTNSYRYVGERYCPRNQNHSLHISQRSHKFYLFTKPFNSDWLKKKNVLSVQSKMKRCGDRISMCVFRWSDFWTESTDVQKVTVYFPCKFQWKRGCFHTCAHVHISCPWVKLKHVLYVHCYFLLDHQNQVSLAVTSSMCTCAHKNLGIHSVIFDVPYVHIFHRSFGKNEQIACWIFFLWSVHMCTKREKTFPISMYFLSIFSLSVIHRRPLKKKWTPDMLCTCAHR